MMDFDATYLYAPAKRDEKFVYPKIELGFALKPHMNNVYGEVFINQTINQDGNEIGILKNIYFNPPDLIFQHLPDKQKVNKFESNCLRKG